MKQARENQHYDQRLKTFIREIESLAAANKKSNPMYAIMDTVPFKDLETALMMARLEHSGPRSGRAM